MNRNLILLTLSALLSVQTWAADEFDGLKCGSDISKALVGKRTSPSRVIQTESRHKDLELKDLGGIELSDRLFLASWLICGTEFELLVNTRSGLIRDVLPFPSHSTSSPEFIGECQVKGTELPDSVIAVLDNSAGLNARDGAKAKTLLKATAAWKIDEHHERFEPLSTDNLGCPLGGVVTLDGGP